MMTLNLPFCFKHKGYLSSGDTTTPQGKYHYCTFYTCSNGSTKGRSTVPRDKGSPIRLTHSVTAAYLEKRERKEAGMLLQILKNLFFGVFLFFVCFFCFTLGKTWTKATRKRNMRHYQTIEIHHGRASMVVKTGNPSPWETKAKECLQVWDQPVLHSEIMSWNSRLSQLFCFSNEMLTHNNHLCSHHSK